MTTENALEISTTSTPITINESKGKTKEKEFTPSDISTLEGKTFSEILLYSRDGIFELIYQEKDIDQLIRYFLLRSVIFASIYGFSLGFFALNLQIIAAAAKVPILLLGTIGICLPALFTFNVLLGSKLNIKQTFSVLLVSNYLLSLVLVSLAPILLFFVISTPNKAFISLLNVGIFMLSGSFGVRLLWNGMQYLTYRSETEYNPTTIRIWSAIYMFVGTQFSWLLRPFLGNKGEFALFRDIEGNFYIAVFEAFIALLQ